MCTLSLAQILWQWQLALTDSLMHVRLIMVDKLGRRLTYTSCKVVHAEGTDLFLSTWWKPFSLTLQTNKAKQLLLFDTLHLKTSLAEMTGRMFLS